MQQEERRGRWEDFFNLCDSILHQRLVVALQTLLGPVVCGLVLSTLLEMMHWREDLAGVATLSRVPPDFQHHGVLLRNEPNPLVKGHDWRFVLSL